MCLRCAALIVWKQFVGKSKEGDRVSSPSVQWLQTSSEVFFRKVSFWDKGGRDAPPVFNVDGVSYLYVKVPPRPHSCLLEGFYCPGTACTTQFHA